MLISGFSSMKGPGEFLLLLDGILVHRKGSPPALNSPVPIYAPGWREALWESSILSKNKIQCPWPGLKPGQLNPEVSTLTMRPLHFDKPVKVPISSKFLFSYLILYLTQWTSAKEKFDFNKMQPFLEVSKTFKFAAILVHHSHQSSLLFEWVVT